MDSQGRSQGVLQLFSCNPSSTTEYTCPEPIVRLPPARLDVVAGVSSRNDCDGIKTYISPGWELPKHTCGDCGTSGLTLRPRSALSAGTVSIRMLWNTCSFNVRSNLTEQHRFEAYVAERNITADAILEGIAGMKLTTEKQAARKKIPPGDAAEEEYEEEIRDAYAECDRKWGADSYFCDEHVRLLRDGFLHWWIEERRTSKAMNSLPADISALPDCWYGYECRTQKNPMYPKHLARFNHICHNTAALRGRS